MPSPVFILENNGDRVIKIGAVGDTPHRDLYNYDDSATSDGFEFTSTLKTEKFSPLGEHEDHYFRKVAVKVRHWGPFSMTIKAFVDDVQTQYYNGSTLTNQFLVYSVTQDDITGKTTPLEEVVEMDISKRGNHIEVQIEVDVDDIGGIFLPEFIEVFYSEVRLQREGGEVD